MYTQPFRGHVKWWDYLRQIIVSSDVAALQGMPCPSRVTRTPCPHHFSHTLTPTFSLPALTVFFSRPKPQLWPCSLGFTYFRTELWIVGFGAAPRTDYGAKPVFKGRQDNLRTWLAPANLFIFNKLTVPMQAGTKSRQDTCVPASNQINSFRDQYSRAALSLAKSLRLQGNSHATDNVKEILVTPQLCLTGCKVTTKLPVTESASKINVDYCWETAWKWIFKKPKVPWNRARQ